MCKESAQARREGRVGVCLVLVVCLLGWSQVASGHQATSRPTSQVTNQPKRVGHTPQLILKRVKAIHGGIGPFAVAGYRIAVAAHRHLGLSLKSFQMSAHHYTPSSVQWNCIADGVQAASNVSPGKLSLLIHIIPSAANTRTTFVHRKTGKKLTFRLTPSFIRRYLNTPRAKLTTAGLQVAKLPERAIFTMSAP